MTGLSIGQLAIPLIIWPPPPPPPPNGSSGSCRYYTSSTVNGSLQNKKKAFNSGREKNRMPYFWLDIDCYLTPNTKRSFSCTCHAGCTEGWRQICLKPSDFILASRMNKLNFRKVYLSCTSICKIFWDRSMLILPLLWCPKS